MKAKKLLSLLLLLAMLTSLLAGCGKKEETKTDAGKGSDTQTEQDAATDGEEQDPAGDDQTDNAEDTDKPYFPLEEQEELSMWLVWENSYMTDPNEMKSVQEMEKRTNVHIDYRVASSQAGAEQFGLMIAGGDYPDIVVGMLSYYTGGIDKGIEDGVFMDMTEYVENYMPTYLEYAATNEDAYRMITSDEGTYPLVYSFSDSNAGIEMQQMFLGLTIRQDWLDELGLAVPVTIDDWHTVLTAFKEQKGADAPLMLMSNGTFPYGIFASAYGVGPEWYVEDGQVKYGPAEAGYKDYLALLNQWYTEGLIDPNFTAQQSAIAPADYMATGRSGAGVNIYVFGGQMYFYMGYTTDANINYVAAPYPVLNEGDTPKAVASAGLTCNNFSLTTGCENPELAARWLDFQYSDESMMLYNYGIEGESYTIDDAGNIAFTDQIMNNPDEYTPSDALGFYYTHTIAPGRQNWEAETYLYDASNYVMQEVWSTVDLSLGYPDNATMTSEEGEKYNTTYVNLKTLVDEMSTKSILGETSLDTYDDFVEQLYSYGLQDCIDIKQAAYDRYMNRGK